MKNQSCLQGLAFGVINSQLPFPLKPDSSHACGKAHSVWACFSDLSLSYQLELKLDLLPGWAIASLGCSKKNQPMPTVSYAEHYLKELENLDSEPPSTKGVLDAHGHQPWAKWPRKDAGGPDLPGSSHVGGQLLSEDLKNVNHFLSRLDKCLVMNTTSLLKTKASRISSFPS